MTRARDINPVRLRREEQGLQLGELANLVKRPNGKPIGAPVLSMVEGGFYPRTHTQQAIADALDTTRETLFPLEFA